MRNKLFYISFLGIILLGAYLYFHKLDSIPSGFYIDEALPGYNAYSLLKTGKDEYGKSFPVALRFLGFYNPPLYTYFTVPSVAFFGLTVFATRFVAALTGLLLIVTTFLFLRLLKINKTSVLLGTLLFTISPWVVLYSRLGDEVGLAFLFFCLGVLFSIWGLKRPALFALSIFFLSASSYTAYTERFLAPLYVIGFTLLFRKDLFSKIKKFELIPAFAVGLITQIPHLTILFTPAFFPKKSLFSATVASQAEKIAHFLPMQVSILLGFLREFLANYIQYFSPGPLFFIPDPDLQRSMPELAVFYPWMAIPYLVGLYFLWKRRKEMIYRVLIMLMLISPLPAALTRDPFASHRAFPLVLPIIAITTLGIDKLIAGRQIKLWLSLAILLILGSLVLLWRSYFVFLPAERAKVWGYGFQQLAEEIKKRPNAHFLIERSRIKPAYVMLAFHLQYPPDKFQMETDKGIKDRYYTDLFFDDYYKFANIETRNLDWGKDPLRAQIIVGDELAISPGQAKEHNLELVFEIRDPINYIVFRGWRTNPLEKLP